MVTPSYWTGHKGNCMNVSGSCYTGELSVFPDTSALSPPKVVSCYVSLLRYSTTFHVQRPVFAAVQAVRSQSKMANSHSMLINVTGAQWNKTYSNVYGNKRESICPVVRVSGSQEDLVFTALPDPELETWGWVHPYFFLPGLCSVRSFLISAMTLPWLTLPQRLWLLWTTLSQPLLQMGLEKAERQGKEEVVFESCH